MFDNFKMDKPELLWRVEMQMQQYYDGCRHREYARYEESLLRYFL